MANSHATPAGSNRKGQYDIIIVGSGAGGAPLAARLALGGKRVLVLAPNFDPGRDAVLSVLRPAVAAHGWHFMDHLPREVFVGLLKRLAGRHGLLLGNSSAGLIEASALNCRDVNVGPRQAGRESPPSVVNVFSPSAAAIAGAVASHQMPARPEHSYGDGHTGPRIASLLAAINFDDPALIRKRCAY